MILDDYLEPTDNRILKEKRGPFPINKWLVERIQFEPNDLPSVFRVR